ncbi:hypothetical protein Gpo141_00007229 [Globisporangium polare]
MASATEERNLLANVQTRDAPGCKLDDLRIAAQETVVKGAGSGFKSLHDAAILTLMWHPFGRAIDTCFARKSQLSVAASGELFLQVARIEASVVQVVSIYKSTERWEQCMLHGLGMLFAGSPEPSSYLFPLVPRVAVSDLPGGQTYSQDEAILSWESLEAKQETSAEPPAKRVRRRPNISKFINDLIGVASRHASSTLAPDASQMTPGLSSHSLRRGAAAYDNACPKLAIQWISTRGAWLLDSLTKAFAYVGTTTREDQSVGRVLADFKDPELACATPSIQTLKQQLSNLEFAQLATLRSKLFVNVTGFTDSSLIVAPGRMRTTWKTENFAQVGASCGGDSAVLTASITQIMTSISAMERKLDKLVAVQEKQSEEQRATYEEAVPSPSIAIRPQERAIDVAPKATTLAGCMYNWYMSELWHAASDKKQQFARPDLKAYVNIMMVASGIELHVPPMPLDRAAAAFGLWEQLLWSLVGNLDRVTNERLHALDGKKLTKRDGSLRKRWSQLRGNSREAYDALCSNFVALKSSCLVLDECTPATHQWDAQDMQ